MEEQEKNLRKSLALLKDQRQARLDQIEKEVEQIRSNMAAQLEAEFAELKEDIREAEAALALKDEETAEVEEELEKAQKQVLDLSVATALLDRQHNELKESIAVAQGELAASTSRVEAIKGELLDIESQQSLAQSSLRNLLNDKAVAEEEIEKAKRNLKDLNEDFDTRKQSLDEELRYTKMRVSESFERLKEIISQDKLIREELAEREIALQKREETVSRKEIKLANAEKRVQALDKYMKL